MSSPQPPRRRRIAGESKPGVPAPAPVKKAARRRLTKSAAPEARQIAPPKHAKTPTAPKTPKTPPAPKTRTTPKTPKTPAPPKTRTAPKTRTTTPATTESQAVAEEEAVAPRKRRFTLSAIRRSGRLGGLVALTVAAVAFGGWFGYQGFTDWRSGNGIVDAHAEAAATAASSAETIFTYRYDKLDEHLEDAQDTMTPSFAEKFETISPALNDLAPQRRIQVKASTRDAAALECGAKCDADRTTILVFIDQARLADDSTEPTVFGNRIEMQMVKTNGQWLVDDVVAL